MDIDKEIRIKEEMNHQCAEVNHLFYFLCFSFIIFRLTSIPLLNTVTHFLTQTPI
jgi:hypothetical protein